jgi:hypothetical protein
LDISYTEIKETTAYESEKMKRITEAITQTKEAHKKLATEYKAVTTDEFNQKKSNLSEETKKKLAENNVNEEEYIQYTISRDKIYEL